MVVLFWALERGGTFETYKQEKVSNFCGQVSADFKLHDFYTGPYFIIYYEHVNELLVKSIKQNITFYTKPDEVTVLLLKALTCNSTLSEIHNLIKYCTISILECLPCKDNPDLKNYL